MTAVEDDFGAGCEAIADSGDVGHLGLDGSGVNDASAGKGHVGWTDGDGAAEGDQIGGGVTDDAERGDGAFSFGGNGLDQIVEGGAPVPPPEPEAVAVKSTVEGYQVPASELRDSAGSAE